MRLLLIRHGQTPSNVQSLLDTAVPGPGLTDLGHEQAAALPETLAGYRIDAIYASTQPRAQLTAAPLAAARGLPVQVRAGLREVGAGDLEMLGDEVSIRTYQGVIRQWINGELDVRMPGGSVGSEVLDRFDAVVEEVVQCLRRDVGENGCAVLFSHGAMLRMWASVRATDLAAAEDALGREHALHNTGMIVLESTAPRAPGWQVLSWAGRAIGGRILDDGTRTGPAGEDPLGSPDGAHGTAAKPAATSR
ncbi:histidine phosphatase family protein [Nakamurella sp. GG22]